MGSTPNEIEDARDASPLRQPSHSTRARGISDKAGQKLPKSAGNGFLWFDGFEISHLAVPADVFAGVALDDGHNLDPCRYP